MSRAPSVRFHLHSATVARWSAAAGIVLIGVHSAVALATLVGMRVSPRIQALVTLQGELNLPSWFSALQLLLAAGLAALVARREHLPPNAKGSGWYTLAALIALHAVDEACAFHERWAPSMPTVFGGTTSSQQWLLVGGAIALGFLAWFAPLLRRVHPETRRAFLMAGVLYYGGAVVLNALAVFVETGGHSTRYLAVSTLAEAAELAGMSALLYAIIRHQELSPVPEVVRPALVVG